MLTVGVATEVPEVDFRCGFVTQETDGGGGDGVVEDVGYEEG